MGDSKPFPPECLGATVLGGCQGSACPQVPSHPITLVPLPQWLFPGELPLSSCRTSKGTNTALQGGSQRQRWKELPRPLKPAGCPAVYPGKLDPSVEGSGRGQCWQIPRKLQKQVCFNRGQISYPPPKPLSPEGLWDCPRPEQEGLALERPGLLGSLLIKTHRTGVRKGMSVTRQTEVT